MTARNPYRATSIVCGQFACSTARNLESLRYIDIEKATPSLPLPGCDSTRCECRYQQHPDRRAVEGERRLPNNLQAQLYESSGNPNRRRRTGGRRKSDWA